MTDTELHPNFQELQRMCRLVYGAKWKGKFAADFGLANQTITAWRYAGPPVWALTGARYALRDQYASQIENALCELVRERTD